MNRKEPQMSRGSMEYIVKQVRKLIAGEISNEHLGIYEDFTIYNFEDIVDGGVVSISYYPVNKGFVGHHHGISKPFTGVIFDFTGRIDINGHSNDVYA